MALACRDHVRGVKHEAIYMISNLIYKLCETEDTAMLRDICQQYEIMVTFLDVLRIDYKSPEN